MTLSQGDHLGRYEILDELEDLPKLPSFSKSDIMANLQAYPPYGDFHGMDRVG